MGLSKPINLLLRGFQFLWALLIMALVGNMIAVAYHNDNPSIVNYSMFVSVFGMLSLFYLIPATIKESFSISPLFPFIVDVLNVIFWFCGAVAFAAELHCHSCDNKAYIESNKITRGAPNKTARCREAQASTAFLWFGFAAFLVSAVFSGFDAKGSSSSIRPGIRRGPAMSQV